MEPKPDVTGECPQATPPWLKPKRSNRNEVLERIATSITGGVTGVPFLRELVQLARLGSRVVRKQKDNLDRLEVAERMARVLSGQANSLQMDLLSTAGSRACMPRPLTKAHYSLLTRIANEAFTDGAVSAHAVNRRSARQTPPTPSSTRSGGPRLRYFRRILRLAPYSYRFVRHWRQSYGTPDERAEIPFDHVLGYTAVLPLNDEGARSYIAGEVSQFEFDDRHIWEPDAEGVPTALYFQALYLRERNNLGFRHLLVRSLARTIADLSPHGLLPSDQGGTPRWLLAEGTSDEGKKLLERLSAGSPIARSKDGNNIYGVRLDDPAVRENTVLVAALRLFSALARDYAGAS